MLQLKVTCVHYSIPSFIVSSINLGPGIRRSSLRFASLIYAYERIAEMYVVKAPTSRPARSGVGNLV